MNLKQYNTIICFVHKTDNGIMGELTFAVNYNASIGGNLLKSTCRCGFIYLFICMIESMEKYIWLYFMNISALI